MGDKSLNPDDQNQIEGADNQGPDIQGEGNYDAGRKFDAEERAFVEKGGYEKQAREAEEALDGPEGEALEKAREESGAHGGKADG
jgi:hypothetical protein